MDCIVIRCANGLVVWVSTGAIGQPDRWVCSRDQFSVNRPKRAADAEATLSAIASHSVTLAGAIQQVVELEI